MRNSADQVLPNTLMSVTPTTPDVKVEVTPIVPGRWDRGRCHGQQRSGQVPGAQHDGRDGDVHGHGRHRQRDPDHPPSAHSDLHGGDDGRFPVRSGRRVLLRFPADGTTTSQITVTLNDHFGNTVAGKTVSLDQGSGKSVISPATQMTNSAGVATFTVTDTTNEFVTYTATDVTDSLVIPADCRGHLRHTAPDSARVGGVRNRLELFQRPGRRIDHGDDHRASLRRLGQPGNGPQRDGCPLKGVRRPSARSRRSPTRRVRRPSR